MYSVHISWFFNNNNFIISTNRIFSHFTSNIEYYFSSMTLWQMIVVSWLFVIILCELELMRWSINLWKDEQLTFIIIYIPHNLFVFASWMIINWMQKSCSISIVFHRTCTNCLDIIKLFLSTRWQFVRINS